MLLKVLRERVMQPKAQDRVAAVMPLVKARALLRVAAAVAAVMPLVKARALLRVAAVANQLRLLLPSKQ
jgi:hypothetical protein